MLSGRPARDEDKPADQSSEHEYALLQTGHPAEILEHASGHAETLAHEITRCFVRLSFTSVAGAAAAGNSKLVIHSATVRDATGSLAAAPGTDAGAVLTLWNPDESWSRDALLRVNAVLGPATRTHTIYEHIELVVHPLGVHLNEAIASSFWVRPPTIR